MVNIPQHNIDLAEFYYKWLGIPVREQPPNHYRLLGLALFEHSAEVIEAAADRQMAHVRTYAGGASSTASQKLLNELSAARVCLLNERLKAQYDAYLRSQLATQPTGVAPVAQTEPIPVQAPAQRKTRISQIGLGQSKGSQAATKPLHHILVWGGVAVVGLLFLFMFLSHIANLGLTAWKERANEKVEAVPPPPKEIPPSPPIVAKHDPPPVPKPEVILEPPQHSVPVAPVESPRASSQPPTNPAPQSAIAPFDTGQARAQQEAWAKYLDRPVVETNSLGMQLVLIPPGEFKMGSGEEEISKKSEEIKARQLAAPQYLIDLLLQERPQHNVRITKAFLIGAHEATVHDFRSFVNATRYKTDAETNGKGAHGFIDSEWKQRPKFSWSNLGKAPIADNLPVVNVSWKDAAKFCDWLSRKEGRHYRLPTEAEWEFACRAGTTTTWSFGDDEAGLDAFGWYYSGNEHVPNPVGCKRPNPFGLFDMYGNVEEWCQDWFRADFYSASPVDDPVGPTTGDTRVRRGGHFLGIPMLDRSASRADFAPSLCHCIIGFRIACDVELKK